MTCFSAALILSAVINVTSSVSKCEVMTGLTLASGAADLAWTSGPGGVAAGTAGVSLRTAVSTVVGEGIERGVRRGVSGMSDEGLETVGTAVREAGTSARAAAESRVGDAMSAELVNAEVQDREAGPSGALISAAPFIGTGDMAVQAGKTCLGG